MKVESTTFGTPVKRTINNCYWATKADNFIKTKQARLVYVVIQTVTQQPYLVYFVNRSYFFIVQYFNLICIPHIYNKGSATIRADAEHAAPAGHWSVLNLGLLVTASITPTHW